jgi:plastocyanin
MIRRWLPMTLGAALALAGAAGAATPSGPRVEIKAFKFVPAQLTVPAGATVTWTNADEETHTVTATDRAYTSTGLEGKETYAHRFAAPGTYTYFCALHPHMTATVVVK